MIIELLKAAGIRSDLFKTTEPQRLTALRDLLTMECDGLLGASVTPHGESGICIVTDRGRYQIGSVSNIPEMAKQHGEYEACASGKMTCIIVVKVRKDKDPKAYGYYFSKHTQKWHCHYCVTRPSRKVWSSKIGWA